MGKPLWAQIETDLHDILLRVQAMEAQLRVKEDQEKAKMLEAQLKAQEAKGKDQLKARGTKQKRALINVQKVKKKKPRRNLFNLNFDLGIMKDLNSFKDEGLGLEPYSGVTIGYAFVGTALIKNASTSVSAEGMLMYIDVTDNYNYYSYDGYSGYSDSGFAAGVGGKISLKPFANSKMNMFARAGVARLWFGDSASEYNSWGLYFGVGINLFDRVSIGYYNLDDANFVGVGFTF